MLSIVERVLILAELPLFEEVRSQDLAYVAQAARSDEYRPGETLYLEGDPPDGLWVVISGGVELRRGGRTLRVLPTQSFGTWGLLDESPRLHTAEVRERSRLLSIEREPFLDVLADHVHVARGMLQSLARRLREAAERGVAPSDEQAERDFG